jgi:hypothetical protein
MFYNLTKWSKMLTLCSFSIGFIIFLSYYFTSEAILVVVGYIFILIASLLNSLMLFWLLLEAVRYKENRKKSLLTALLVLANIPIMLVLIFFTLNKM